MSLRSQPTPFDLHCAQAVADHEALRKKQLQKATDATQNETTNQPVVASKLARPNRQSGLSLQDEDESYNTTLMEIEPVPERPALRVLNLLSRMGPPAKSAHTAFKTSNKTLKYNPWSAKGVLKSRKKLTAVQSTKADWVTCKDWNYGGDDACEEGCYYEHICAKCFENYGARHAHPYLRCENVVRGGKNNEEVVVPGVQEGHAVGGDSLTYPGSARRVPGQGQSPKQWSNVKSLKEPLRRDFDMPPVSVDTVPYDSHQEEMELCAPLRL
ncbi:hypothetical protein FS837_012379 [Tulasnella sp. UAMH 9824]|nr:hypothetical protein FS837_012379 [Tulasnella sp. UAMH 9824]